MIQVSELLKPLLDNKLLQKRKTVYILKNKWSDIAGKDRSVHSLPVNLQRETLMVAVDNPACLTDMEFSKEDLLKKIQKKDPFSSVKKIRFVVQNLPEKKDVPKKKDPAETDPVLRQAVGRLLKKLSGKKIRSSFYGIL